MTILDLKYTHTDYIKNILPFIKNGVFIDTSVMKVFIDGFLKWKFSKKLEESYQNLSDLFEALKLTNWNKLLITPHILTEICHHFVCDKDSFISHCGSPFYSSTSCLANASAPSNILLCFNKMGVY